jgi:hypothetical protein
MYVFGQNDVRFFVDPNPLMKILLVQSPSLHSAAVLAETLLIASIDIDVVLVLCPFGLDVGDHLVEDGGTQRFGERPEITLGEDEGEFTSTVNQLENIGRVVFQSDALHVHPTLHSVCCTNRFVELAPALFVSGSAIKPIEHKHHSAECTVTAKSDAATAAADALYHATRDDTDRDSGLIYLDFQVGTRSERDCNYASISRRDSSSTLVLHVLPGETCAAENAGEAGAAATTTTATPTTEAAIATAQTTEPDARGNDRAGSTAAAADSKVVHLEPLWSTGCFVVVELETAMSQPTDTQGHVGGLRTGTQRTPPSEDAVTAAAAATTVETAVAAVAEGAPSFLSQSGAPHSSPAAVPRSSWRVAQVRHHLLDLERYHLLPVQF